MFVLPASAQKLAADQFGVVARFQLLRWMTEGQVDGLVERRLLVPIERGAYRVAGGAVVPEQAAMAAVLRARPGARVTGPFVLGLFDVDGFTAADPFEILRRPGRRMRNVPFPHRVDPFPDERRARFNGMPVVDPTTALLDTARFLPEIGDRRIRVGFDSARWRGLTTPARLRERAGRLPRSHPGVAFFSDLDVTSGLAPESEPERVLGEELLRFEPMPEPQVWVTPRRRVDWYVRVLRLAPEYFGDVDHTTANARLADQRRANELDAVGVRILPVVARDLREREGLVAWLQHVFAVRAHELDVEPPQLVR